MSELNKRTQRDFRDILIERRQELSHLPWVNRKLDLLKSYMPEQTILPSRHKSAVLNSKKVQDIVAKISRDYNIPDVVVLNHIKDILKEIGFNKSIPTLRTLAYVLTKICTTVCRGIFVNTHSVHRMKEELGHANAPVLYLPSHRSYADFILMSYVLFTLNIDIPAIAAGMDFHGMVGMGKILRDTGAFFMRRSYNSDNLYWDIFRQYVLQICKSGNTGIEFFIEGTRSRTGKSLSPKLGLLSMILKAYLTSDVYNLLIIPINISYERIMEENLFAFELLGVPKPAESTSGFFKALKIIKEDFGSVFIDFGAPISVRQFFNGRIDRSQHINKPIHLQEFTEHERSVISHLADEIVNHQQNLTVFTTFNIIAIILNHHISALNTKSVSLSTLITEVTWLSVILKTARVISEDLIKESLKIHANLILYDNKNIQLNDVEILLDDKQREKMKGHILNNDTMTKAIPMIKLQIYINPVMYYLIDGALVVKILSNKPTDLHQTDLLQQFQFIRRFMSRDFVYPKNSLDTLYHDAILFLTTQQSIKITNQIVTLHENKLNNYLNNLIEPFLFTYRIMCLVLLETAVELCSEKTLFVNCQSKLEQIMQKQFVHPYCLNLDTLSNCKNILIEFDCLHVNIKDGNRFYSVNAVNINNLLGDLDSILGMLKYKLHINNKL